MLLLSLLPGCAQEDSSAQEGADPLSLGKALMEPREEGSGLRLSERGGLPPSWPRPDLTVAAGDPPAVALLLVQLQLVLVDVEFSDQGIALRCAGSVGVVQEELVVQFFLPLRSWRQEEYTALFALLGERGDDSHGDVPPGGETVSTGQT